MRKITGYFVLASLLLSSCNGNKTGTEMTTDPTNTLTFQSGYSNVNGIKMYYEIHGGQPEQPAESLSKGSRRPLILIHGGGSTIETSFGRVIPELAKNRKLICVELQAHGRTGDRNTGISFEQDADDVATLMDNLGIEKADILGFSNGGNTALQLAIRHPQKCHKIIAASVLLKRDGTPPQFWEFMNNGTFEQMPQPYKDAFMKVTPDSTKLKTMYQKCADRMVHFKDFPDSLIRSIQSPVLFINGTQDVATSEHIQAMARLVPNAEALVFPGGHGVYMGEINTLMEGYESGGFVGMVEEFLK